MGRWYVSLAVLFSLSGCLTTQSDRYTYIERGQKYCRKHRVPFVTRRMFEPPPYILIHYGEERCAECGERFPNEIGPRYSRHRSFVGEPYAPTETVTVAYCPVCEEAFRKCVKGSPCEYVLTSR
jgi:hypothetical protein